MQQALITDFQEFQEALITIFPALQKTIMEQRGPGFKTTGHLQGRLNFWSFRG